MGYTGETNSYVTIQGLFTGIINELADNGFTVIWHDGTTDHTDAVEATLEASSAVDPLNTSQPWRIKLNGHVAASGSVTVGTPLQLPDDGSEYQVDGTLIPAGRSALNPDIIGVIEDYWVLEELINPATPYSLRVCITDRGMTFHMWQNADLDEKDWSMICIQRLVDPVTGEIFTAGHSPVIAFYTLDMGANFYKIVVRENDVVAPTIPTLVSEDGTYINSIINPMKQISIAETNQYYITFPAGINTHRHLYNEEMDMIAYTSAGVLSQYNDARLNVYGHGSLPFNNGQEEIFAGDKIFGSASKATAIVRAVNVSSGDWSTNNAEGTLILHSINGTFLTSDNITVGATLSAVATDESSLEYRKYKGGLASVNNAEGVRVLFLTENGGIES